MYPECFVLFNPCLFLNISVVASFGTAVTAAVLRVYVTCLFFYIFPASWWMCRPRTNRVYLWAAQRPYPASLGNISSYKGTALSSDTLWEQTVPVTPTQYKISAKGCYCFTCVMFWQVQKYGTMEMHWIFLLFIHSGPLFFSVFKGETKQCQEWLLCFNGWQRAQYDPWWTSASGSPVPSKSFY